MCSQLLVDLLRFLAPFKRNVVMSRPMQSLFKGVLRVFLLLLHDFQEFLAEFYYPLVVEMPPNCLQLRNVVLSAFPKGVKAPDPSAAGLSCAGGAGGLALGARLDLLDLQEPVIARSTAPELIRNDDFRNRLDSYLSKRSPVTFLSELPNAILLKADSTTPAVGGGAPGAPGAPGGQMILGSKYNWHLLNGLVLFVANHGTQMIKHYIAAHNEEQTKQSQTGQPTQPAQLLSWGLVFGNRKLLADMTAAHRDIFETLLVNLDDEGRYLLSVALVTHLRYPQAHTIFFTSTLVTLMQQLPSVPSDQSQSSTTQPTPPTPRTDTATATATATAEPVPGRTEPVPVPVPGRTEPESAASLSPVMVSAPREVLTRALLERVMGGRPYPWGVVLALLEIVRDPRIDLRNHDFVKFHPDMEKYVSTFSNFLTFSYILPF